MRLAIERDELTDDSLAKALLSSEGSEGSENYFLCSPDPQAKL